MPSGVEQFVSAVKRSRIWSEDDVIDFFQTQSAFSGCGVVCGRPVQDLPLELVVLVFLSAFPADRVVCGRPVQNLPLELVVFVFFL